MVAKINLSEYHLCAQLDNVEGNCGVYELFDLEAGPRDCVLATFVQNTPPLVMFSDAIVYKNGDRLAKYIQKHRLGSIRASVSVVNRFDGLGHRIKSWVWAPNKRALKRWMNENTEGDTHELW